MADQTDTPATEGISARRAAVVSCWMCGIRLHSTQMMPDGGSACADIRWYCTDARACTQRWASSARQEQDAGVG